MSVVLCLTTCPEREGALVLARALVDEGLAACINIVPGAVSLYRWQGAVEQADELQLFIKTTQAQLVTLKARVCDLHPHDVPELIVLQVADGLPAYLGWVVASVRTEAPEAS